MNQPEITPERIIELRKMADNLSYRELPVLIALAGLRSHQEMVVDLVENGDCLPSDVANTPDEIACVVDDIEGDRLSEIDIKGIIKHYNLADYYTVTFRSVMKTDVICQR